MLSSLRNFFLSLFLFLIVFGIGAYFLLGYTNNFINDFQNQDLNPGANLEDETTAITTEDTSQPEEELFDPSKPYKFTAVVIGTDDGKSQPNETEEADSIFLIDINAKTKTFMISPISCDTKIVVKGYKLRLGSVLPENDEVTFFEAVRALTGIMPDYYCIVDYKGLEDIINTLGTISFTIPMDMYYVPWMEPVTNKEGEIQTTTAEIDLKMGSKKLRGNEMVDLFRYKGYSNGNEGRMATQVAIIKEILKQKINLEALLNSKLIYDGIKKNVKTNFTDADFEKYGELLFTASSFTITDMPYPGRQSPEFGVMFLDPDLKRALEQYRPFKKIFDSVD